MTLVTDFRGEGDADDRKPSTPRAGEINLGSECWLRSTGRYKLTLCFNVIKVTLVCSALPCKTGINKLDFNQERGGYMNTIKLFD